MTDDYLPPHDDEPLPLYGPQWISWPSFIYNFLTGEYEPIYDLGAIPDELVERYILHHPEVINIYQTCREAGLPVNESMINAINAWLDKPMEFPLPDEEGDDAATD